MKLIETCPWVTVFSPLSPLSLLWKLPSLLLRWLPQDLQDPQGLFDAWHPMQGAWPWVLAPPLHRKDLRLAVARQANPKQRRPGKTRCCTSHKSPILSARDVPWISPRIARCRRHKRVLWRIFRVSQVSQDMKLWMWQEHGTNGLWLCSTMMTKYLVFYNSIVALLSKGFWSCDVEDLTNESN